MRKSLTKVEIKQIFREAAAIKDSGFKLLYKKNSTDLSRMAVTTPRNYGNAVERNRTKRIIREVFRRIKEQLKDGGYVHVSSMDLNRTVTIANAIYEADM